jgi:hypothetical protein
MKTNAYRIFTGVVYFALVFLVHSLFQNNKIYEKSIDRVTLNYVNENGEIKQGKTPYKSIVSENMLHWDAIIFNKIKQNGYDTSGGDYIFASFPLFPLFWKATQASPLGISVLNILIFIISLAILFASFFHDLSKKNAFWGFIILTAFPTVVPFMIPYSESLFLLFVSVALWGIVKKIYWIYFIGFMLASATRSVVVILLFAFLCTELLFFIQHKKLPLFMREVVVKTAPVVCGTFLASAFQLLYGSGSMLKFIDAQKYWGSSFAIPTTLSDWSVEGFGINMAISIMIVLPLLVFLLVQLLSSFKTKEKSGYNSLFTANASEQKKYLFLLSGIYIAGVFFFILFFRNGCLYGIYRYAASTPFFYVFLLCLHEHLISSVQRIAIFLIWALTFFISIKVLENVSYAPEWNFSDLGFFLFSFGILLWIIPPKHNAIKLPLVFVYILLSATWCSFLYNMFLSNAWICT